MLKYNGFVTRQELVDWWNTKVGTEDIVSICFDQLVGKWIIFYIRK